MCSMCKAARSVLRRGALEANVPNLLEPQCPLRLRQNPFNPLHRLDPLGPQNPLSHP